MSASVDQKAGTPAEPNRIEVLSRVSPAGARTYMERRAAILENSYLDRRATGW
jgi:hypothetical protein